MKNLTKAATEKGNNNNKKNLLMTTIYDTLLNSKIATDV